LPDRDSPEQPRPDPIGVPALLRPTAGEGCVWSAIAFEDGGDWHVAAASLLNVPLQLASTSWMTWERLQPPTARPAYDRGGFDLGPLFDAEPFPGVRIMRWPVAAAEWSQLVAQIASGRVRTLRSELRISTSQWSPLTMVPTETIGDDRAVVAGSLRPVVAVLTDLTAPAPPVTEPTWDLRPPPHLPRGRDLAQIARHRNLYDWPTG